MKRLGFWVEGIPKTFTRDVAVRASHGYKKLPEELVAWRNAVQYEFLIAARKHGLPYELQDGSYLGLVGLRCELYGCAGDWDNAGKEISDALEGVGYRNDRQIQGGKVVFPDRALTAKGAVDRSKLSETPGAHILLVWWGA